MTAAFKTDYILPKTLRGLVVSALRALLFMKRYAVMTMILYTALNDNSCRMKTMDRTGD